MNKSRIPDYWVMGATVSAYVVLTFVVYFWGSAFAQPFCGNSPTPPSVFLVFLFPGAIVGVLDWAQTKLAQTRTGLVSHRGLQVALWMNLFGILGILVVVAGNYGPDRYWFFALRVYLGLVADGCAMVAEAMRFRPHERPVKVSERFGERDAFARYLFDEASHAICCFLSLRIRYALCSKAC